MWFLCFPLLFIVIIIIKKSKQLGNTWDGASIWVQIAGKELCCKHCGNTRFRKREGILVTSWVSFFNFNFWNRSAACYTCMECGHVEWFANALRKTVETGQKELP